MIVLRPYNTPGLVTFTLRQAGSDAFATSSHWTPSASDIKLSLDGGTQAPATNLPTFSNGQWNLILMAAELEAARVRINIDDGDIIPESILIETYGHASAAYPTAYTDQWLGIASKITSDHGVGSYVDTGAGLDAAGVRTAVGLASANLDTQLAAIPTVAPLDATATEAAALAAVNSYAPAKAGDAMTLTTGERAAVRSDLLTTVQFTNSLPANFGTLVIDVNGEVIASNMVSEPPTIGDFQTAVEDGLTAYDAPNRTDISGGGGGGATADEIWTHWPRTLTPPDDSQNPSIVAHRHAGTLYQGFDYLSSGHTQLSLMEQTPSEWDKDIIDIGGLKLHLRNVQTGHSVTVPATSTYNSTSQIHTLKAELDSSQIPTKTGLYKGFFYASSSGTGSPTDYFLITTFSVNVEQGISNC